MDFFETWKLLKEVNATLIALVSKVPNPQTTSELRYKAITKLICQRMREVLLGIVDLNQSAFVAGRSIMHNIMLSEDLMRLI